MEAADFPKPVNLSPRGAPAPTPNCAWVCCSRLAPALDNRYLWMEAASANPIKDLLCPHLQNGDLTTDPQSAHENEDNMAEQNL